jgi:FAD binding domain-containing protein
MNTGLIDAVLLSEALARVVGGKARDGLLDLYSERRRPAAEQVLVLAGRLTGLAMLRSPAARAVRNALLRILNRVGRFKRIMTMNLSGLGRRDLAALEEAPAPRNSPAALAPPSGSGRAMSAGGLSAHAA